MLWLFEKPALIEDGRPGDRPLIRWKGCKHKIAWWIIGLMPPHWCYAEPFGGGAGVLMRKPRSRSEVYNDLDGRLVNVFRVLRDPAMSERLEALIRLTPFARAEYELAFERADDPVEDARRTLALAFMGHGSDAASRQCRSGFRASAVHRKGGEAWDWAHYPDYIRGFTDRLRGVVIECSPAAKVFELQDSPKTLFYVDPPYTLASRTMHHGHEYKFEMTDADHIALAGVLHGLQGMVMLSGYASPLYDELYKGWRCVSRGTFANKARPRTECLWMSPNIEVVQMGLEACLPITVSQDGD